MEHGPFEDVFPLNMGILHCYVSLPKGFCGPVELSLSNIFPFLHGTGILFTRLGPLMFLDFKTPVELDERRSWRSDRHQGKLTANAPQIGPSQRETIVFQPSIFKCKLLVSGRVHPCTSKRMFQFESFLEALTKETGQSDEWGCVLLQRELALPAKTMLY